MFIIAGKYYRHKIQAPKTELTRPTASRLRETLFNIIQQEIEGSDFLDIFAGSGAIGIEALSRGARSSAFIESNRDAFSALNNNLKQLKITSEGVALFGDYVKNLQALSARKVKFHLIFADAPYHMNQATQILLDQIVSKDLLKPYGKVFIENDQKLAEDINLHGLMHINSRKSGKSYLHQFQKVS